MSGVRCAVQVLFPAALCILLAGASTGRATTVRTMTFSQVVDGAELIAVGTVSAVEQTWDAERATPFTHVTFSDVEVLKGALPDARLTLRLTGGPAPNGLVLAISGMPRFEVGQVAVLFSAGNGVHACPLVGWWQGLYRVVHDDDRDRLVVSDHAWRPVARLDGAVGQRVAQLLPPSAPSGSEALTLDAFKRLIVRELQ